MARKLSSREYMLLGVLAVVAAVVVYYRFGQDGQSAGMASEEERQGSGGSADAPAVMLALLDQQPEAYDPGGRDLFKYADRPETAAERAERLRREREAERLRREAEERRRLAELAKKKKEQEKPPAPPPKPRGPVPPRVSFRYLGYLGPKDDRIAVFENGKDLLLARAGEAVQDEFLVREIKYQKVVIGYTKEEFKHMTTELRMAKAR